MDPTIEEVTAGLFGVEHELDRLARLMGPAAAEEFKAAVRTARWFAVRARLVVEREARLAVARRELVAA